MTKAFAIKHAKEVLRRNGYAVVPPRQSFRLTPTQKQIYDFLCSNSKATAAELRLMVWPNGGVKSNVLSVHIAHLNKRLALRGVAVKSTFGRNAVYRLERKNHATDA